MNELKVFSNEQFGQVRTVVDDGKVWFCGSDVAKALGYSQTAKAVREHCKQNGCLNRTVIDSMGREQQAKFISEGNLYRLITHSKLPSAERFESCRNDDIVYVAIASDETERLEKERKANKRFPLVDWGITEAECLQGCCDYGFTWGGLYEHLDRVSCMYCTNKNLKELRNIRRYYPDVWDKLKAMQDKTDRPYKKGVTVYQLEARFELEDEYTKRGLSIRNRAFFKALRERLEAVNDVKCS